MHAVIVEISILTLPLDNMPLLLEETLFLLLDDSPKLSEALVEDPSLQAASEIERTKANVTETKLKALRA